MASSRNRSGVREHARSNLIGYAALFVALTGTAYAGVSVNSVGTKHLKPGAVTTPKIAPKAVKTPKIAPDAVKTPKIAPGAVKTGEIATGAVRTGQIANGAVRTADLAAAAVNAGKIATAAVTGAKIAAAAVTGSKIAADAVDSSKIADGAVKSDEIAANAVNSTKIANGSLGPSEFASSLPAVSVTRANDQSIAGNGTLTPLVFPQERYDTASMHNTLFNSSRLTAPIGGIYSVEGNVFWDSNATGLRSAFLVKNGVTSLGADTRSAASAGFTRQTVSRVVRLQQGEYVQLQVAQTTGANLLIRKEDQASPEFSMTWLAPGP